MPAKACAFPRPEANHARFETKGPIRSIQNVSPIGRIARSHRLNYRGNTYQQPLPDHGSCSAELSVGNIIVATLGTRTLVDCNEREQTLLNSPTAKRGRAIIVLPAVHSNGLVWQDRVHHPGAGKRLTSRSELKPQAPKHNEKPDEYVNDSCACPATQSSQERIHAVHEPIPVATSTADHQGTGSDKQETNGYLGIVFTFVEPERVAYDRSRNRE